MVTKICAFDICALKNQTFAQYIFLIIFLKLKSNQISLTLNLFNYYKTNFFVVFNIKSFYARDL